MHNMKGERILSQVLSVLTHIVHAFFLKKHVSKVTSFAMGSGVSRLTVTHVSVHAVNAHTSVLARSASTLVNVCRERKGVRSISV